MGESGWQNIAFTKGVYFKNIQDEIIPLYEVEMVSS